MKNFFYACQSFLLILFFQSSSFAQTKTFTGAGSWHTASNWTPSGVPTDANDVIIQQGETVTISTGNAVCKSLTFNNTGASSSSITISNSRVLNITNNLSFAALTSVSRTNTFNINNGTVNCGSITYGAVSGSSKSIINVTTGLLNVAGTTIFDWTGNDQQLNITGTGTFKFAGNVEFRAGRFNPGTTSTIEDARNGNMNLLNPSSFYLNTVYPNLTISGTGTKSPAAGLTIDRDFNLNAGILSMLYHTLTINGNTTVASGAKLLDNAGGGNHIFNGTLTNNGTIEFTAYHESVYGGLFTNNGVYFNTTGNYNPMTFRAGIINNGSWTAGKGQATFNTTNQSLAGSKSITFYKIQVASGITLTNNNADTIFVDADGLNGVDASSTFVNASGTVLSLKHGAPMTTGVINAIAVNNTVIFDLHGFANATSGNYYHIEKSGSGNLVFNGSYTILGNLKSNVGAGPIRISTDMTVQGDLILEGTDAFQFETANKVLTVNGNITGTGPVSFYTYSPPGTKLRIGGNYTNTGLLTPGGGTIEYFGTNQIVKAGDYYNLLISGSGTKTLAGNITINASGGPAIGNFTLNSGVTLDASTHIISAARSGATFNINGTLETGNSNGFIDHASATISNINSPVVQPFGDNSVIVYKRVGNQNIAGRDYKGLTILNTGTKTLSGPITVAGPFNFSSGVLKIGNNSLALNGSIGSFTGSIAGGTNAVLDLSATGPSVSLNVLQTPATEKIFKTLVINRANGAVINNPMEINTSVKITNGNLNSSGNLTLLSNAGGTARVDSIVCVSCGITGNITVQRFIPGGSGKRRWRLLASPVNVGGSISLTQFIDNIHVTGPGGASNGFDPSPMNNHSIKTYTESVPGISSNGWNLPANINTNVETGRGICVFVRGSRSTIDPFNTGGTPDNATIDFTGALNSRNIVFPLSFTNTGSTADGFNLVGNPYPSSIDWRASLGWTKSNVQNKIWIYNPTTGTYGTYDATLNVGTNSCTRHIGSGQAFFVKATAPGSLTFTEKLKVDSIPSSFYKTAPVENLLRMFLVKDSSFTDEAIVYLSETGTKNDGDDHDANKFFNDEINFYSVSANGVNLTINEYPKAIENDTINLAVYSYSAGQKWSGDYKLSFTGMSSFTDSTDLYLYDKYEDELTNIKIWNEYPFLINEDAGSMGIDRFKLILRKNLSSGISRETVMKESFVKAFPNPFKESISFMFSDKLKNTNVNIQIVDALGKTILSYDQVDANDKFTVQLPSDLISGMFIARIHSEKGIEQVKLIKH